MTTRTRPQTHTDRETGLEFAYKDYTDLDTIIEGRDAPFSPWMGDHTAFVHVLWSLKGNGLIGLRPDRGAPLRLALFERLHGDHKQPWSEGLIEDLRAILDAHDPEVTPGAFGAERVGDTDAEVVAAMGPEPSPREPGGSDAIAAGVIKGSRAMAAHDAYVCFRALNDAAKAEDEAGFPEAAARLRERARVAVEGDAPATTKEV